MSAISLKSITGITSITTPAGVDNQLTLHTNDTTERVKIDVSGNVHINNHLAITGLTTASQGLRVPNGSATTNYISVGDNGALRFWGTGHQYADIRAGNLHFRNAALENVLEIQQDKEVYFYGSAFLQNARFDQTVTIADTITHHGDTDTKIRFPAADTVTVETAGSERFRITSSGQFHMGGGNSWTYASQKFVVVEPNNNLGMLLQGNNANEGVNLTLQNIVNANNAYSSLSFADDGGQIFGVVRGKVIDKNANTGELQFHTSSNERLCIESGGDVDIKSGVLKLASGANRRLMYRSGDNDVLLESDSGDFYRQNIANSSHSFFTGNVERLRIASDGNMGLGTNSLVGNAANIYLTVNGSTLGGIAFKANGTTQGTLTGSGGEITLASDGTKPITFDTNGSERFKITTSSVIATSNTGHMLLGTDTARTVNGHNARLQVTGTTFSHSTVSIINNEANANGAYLFLGKQRSGSIGGGGAVQANDIIGELRFVAGDGTDMENNAARIIVRADQNASSNNTSGYIDFYTTRQNGSSQPKMRIGQNSNHSHIFSMGTGSTHMNNASTPDRTSLKVGGSLHLEGPFGHNAHPGVYYNCYSGGNDNFYRGTNAPNNQDYRPAAYTMAYGSHYFRGDNSSTAWSAQQQITSMQANMIIYPQGYVRKPYAPAFDAVKTNGSQGQSANTKIVFNSTLTNVGNHYNTSTGVFTAPTAGTYFFSMFGMSNNILAWYNFRKNGSVISPQHGTYQTNGTDWSSVGMTIVIVLAANDTMAVYTAGDNKIGMYGGGNNHNGFCGYMLG